MSTNAQSLREKICKNLAPGREKATLGGQAVDVLQPDLRRILNSAENDTPESRAKFLADSLYVPGSNDKVFDSADSSQIDMLLSLAHNEEMSKIYQIIGSSIDGGAEGEGEAGAKN